MNKIFFSGTFIHYIKKLYKIILLPRFLNGNVVCRPAHVVCSFSHKGNQEKE